MNERCVQIILARSSRLICIAYARYMLGDGAGEGVAVGGREPGRPAPAPAGRTATSSRVQTISIYV